MKELCFGDIKPMLDGMGIPCTEGDVPGHLMELISSFGYKPYNVLADLNNLDTVDAELGVVVQNANPDVDNGLYIFTVLHSGQAGFIVVEPGTVSRASVVRRAAGDILSAVTAVDLPPMTPFDMVEVTAHVLAGTFLKTVMQTCGIPEEQEQAFLRLYMPRFLANVGMYFVGAVKEDGTPMIYEETVNMEPMALWRAMRKSRL